MKVTDFEAKFSSFVPKNAYDYFSSGANAMETLSANRKVFSDLRLMPRVLVDVSRVNVETSLLGTPVGSPICIAPTAMQKMAHPDGEIAVAKAAASANTLMCLSSWSTTTLEDVQKCSLNSPKWFQLYVYKDRCISLEIIRRAEKAGYKALVLTVDTPILGYREADVRNRFALPGHLTLANFSNLIQGHSSQVKDSKTSGLAAYVSSQIDSSLDWGVIEWLRAHSTIKIVVKGILTAEDAVEASKRGVDAIWVSNHGARQLDTSPATIEVLGEIVQRVRESGDMTTEIYVDGGITRGTDVVKCLALGARAVFIGRPVLWGLAAAGETGVSKVLQLLNQELVLAMKLMGASDVSVLRPSHVRHVSTFNSNLVTTPHPHPQALLQASRL